MRTAISGLLILLLSSCSYSYSNFTLPPPPALPAGLKTEDLPDAENPLTLQFINNENKFRQTNKHIFRSQIKNISEELSPYYDVTPAVTEFENNGYNYFIKKFNNTDFDALYRSNINSGNQELVLNPEFLLTTYSSYILDSFRISDDNKFIAFKLNSASTDRLIICEINSSAECKTGPTAILSYEWTTDNSGIIYSKLNKLRADSLFFYNLNTNDDTLIFKSTDLKSNLTLGKSSDQKIIFLYENSTGSQEIYAISANQNHTYLNKLKLNGCPLISADHNNEQYYLLCGKPEAYKAFQYEAGKVKKFIPLTDIELFSLKATPDYFYISGRKIPHNYLHFYDLNFNYITSYSDTNFGTLTPLTHHKQSAVTLSSSNIVNPKVVKKFDPITKISEVMYSDKLSPRVKFNPEEYITEIIHLRPGIDNQLSLSIFYKKNTKLKNIHLFTYAAYNKGPPSGFDPYKFFLINQGDVVTLAHIPSKGIHAANDINTATAFLSEKFKIKKVTLTSYSAGALSALKAASLLPQNYSCLILENPFTDHIMHTKLKSDELVDREKSEWKGLEISDQLPADFPSTIISASINDPIINFSQPLSAIFKIRKNNLQNNSVLMISSTESHRGENYNFQEINNKAEVFSYCR